MCQNKVRRNNQIKKRLLNAVTTVECERPKTLIQIAVARSEQYLHCQDILAYRVSWGSIWSVERHSYPVDMVWAQSITWSQKTVVGLKLERATVRNLMETSHSSHLRSQQLGPVVEAYSNIGVVRTQCILPHLNVSKAQTVCLNILALESWTTQKESNVGKQILLRRRKNPITLLRHTPTGGWPGPSVFSAICFASTALHTCTGQC